MSRDPFDRDHAPVPGVAEPLAAGLSVVTAPNPGPMTFTGTRTYLLGTREVAVIDPGPEDPAHQAAVAAAVPAGARVTAILVTHAHRDHSSGARALQGLLQAPLLGFGPAERSPVMAALAAQGGIGGGEGIDPGFAPDRRLGDGEEISGEGWRLRAVHTPGHLGDHLSFAWAEGEALFSGDTVMGWATTLISPPDGDLGAFLASLRRLRARPEGRYFPGHGKPVDDPHGLIDWQIRHRAEREEQIRAALGGGPRDVSGLVAAVYPGLDPVLRGAAGRNVLAHLIDLSERGIVASEGELTAGAAFGLV